MEDKENLHNLKPKSILSTLDVIKISDQEIDKLYEIVKIRNRTINQKLVKIPEFPEEDFKKIVIEEGYEFNDFEGIMSFVYKDNISNENSYEEECKLEDLKEKIKDAQLSYIDENKSDLDVKNEAINIIASAISRANKKFHVDKNKSYLFFKNLLGSLIERAEDNLAFFDDNEIKKIVEASIGDEPEDVKKNLEELSRDIIVKFRKLFLVFSYDQLSTKIINYQLAEGELYKLQENKFIEIEGNKLRVFSFKPYGKQYFVAVDVQFGDIITFNLGKKRKTELDPIIHSIFFDRISFYVQKEFLHIVITAMERLKIDMVSHLAEQHSETLEKYTLQEIRDEQEEIDNLSYLLYNQISIITNKVQANNRDYTQNIIRKKTRYLARVFGGAIKQDIYSLLPLDMIESSQDMIMKIQNSNQNFYNFMSKEISQNYKLAIEAKSQNKPKLFKEVTTNIKNNAIKYLSDPKNLLLLGKKVIDFIKNKGLI